MAEINKIKKSAHENKMCKTLNSKKNHDTCQNQQQKNSTMWKMLQHVKNTDFAVNHPMTPVRSLSKENI